MIYSVVCYIVRVSNSRIAKFNRISIAFVHISRVINRSDCWLRKYAQFRFGHLSLKVKHADLSCGWLKENARSFGGTIFLCRCWIEKKKFGMDDTFYWYRAIEYRAWISFSVALSTVSILWSIQAFVTNMPMRFLVYFFFFYSCLSTRSIIYQIRAIGFDRTISMVSILFSLLLALL